MSVLQLVGKVGTGALGALNAVCSLAPKKKRIVCISRQSNTPPTDFRLIKEYCEARPDPVQVKILAKQLHNPLAYLPHMAQQVYFIATSKAVVLDSYCIAVSLLRDRIKAPVVQIWHAMGNMKKFGYDAFDSEEGRSPQVAEALHMHEGYTTVVVSSQNFAEDFARGFRVDPAIMKEAPLPRTDLLIDPEYRAAHRQKLIEAYPQLGDGRQVIVYAPTFRQVKPENEDEAMQALIHAVDFSRYQLVFKPHPVSTQVIDDPRVLTVREPGLDPLFAADYVISDYSTLIYEAGLLQVPVFLYAYDWDSYEHKRGLNIDLQHDVPTLFTGEAQEIMRAIEDDAFDHEAYQEFMSQNIALPADASCTEHLSELIISLFENESGR